MNRKERRAAQKRGQSATGGARDERLQRLLVEAVQQHQAGRFAEAERGYRSVLASDPRSSRSLYNYGILALQTQRNDLAVDLLTQAVKIYDRDPEWHYNLGYALQQAGRPGQAIAHYQRAVAMQPNYLEAQVNLGNTLHDLGRLDEAVECYRRAVAVKADLPDLHYNLGNALNQLGRSDEAIASLGRALALKPHADVHNNLGIALMRDPARMDEALGHYRQALALEPGHVRARNNVGLIHLMRGEPQEAAAVFSGIVKAHPDDADAQENLAQALLAQGDAPAALAALVPALKLRESRRAKSFFVIAIKQVHAASEQPVLRDLLLRALAEGWGRVGDLAGVAGSFVKADRSIAACLARAVAAWPQYLAAEDLFGADGLAALADDRLLLTLLEAARITDLDLERFLTAVRSALLAQAMAPPSATESETILRLRAALAQQCFINEYVFAVSDDDARATDALRTELSAALDASAALEERKLLALASMMPLHTLPQAERLLDRPYSEPVAAVLRQQVREPLQEREMRPNLPRLTPIEDGVSREVQAQYEENPYPRWTKVPQPPLSLTVEQHLRALFPLLPFRPRDTGGKLDILIAGCGTGQHSIEVAQQYPHARILAIDLSAASLAYAVRKTREAGIGNIDYAQADILELGAIEGRFDIIESSGVLHHLADPFAGGRVLVSLLRPGGLMFLGLYSALARQNIVAARRFIAERGYRPAAEDIRRCRQDLMRMTEDSALNAVKGSNDFFTISDCRDLLFHVQERRLGLPEIRDFLAVCGLRLFGFDLAPASLQAYSAQFPQDRMRTNLDQWHAFETQNPATFVGMYQFWAQREL